MRIRGGGIKVGAGRVAVVGTGSVRVVTARAKCTMSTCPVQHGETEANPDFGTPRGLRAGVGSGEAATGSQNVRVLEDRRVATRVGSRRPLTREAIVGSVSFPADAVEPKRKAQRGGR